MDETLIDGIITFWFGDPDRPEFGETREAWFKKDAAFDAAIRARFEQYIEPACRGDYDALAETPLGAVALCVLLDQFPRNVYRESGQAFSCDEKALSIAKKVVDQGLDKDLPKVMRMFLYLPFEHSESMEEQNRSMALFGSLDDANLLDYAQRHRDIIARFGRYPHRNALLGRESTPEEQEFLTQPGSSF